jgi:hypothetical protein
MNKHAKVTKQIITIATVDNELCGSRFLMNVSWNVGSSVGAIVIGG